MRHFRKNQVPIVCQWCDKAYQYEKDLVRHQKRSLKCKSLQPKETLNVTLPVILPVIDEDVEIVSVPPVIEKVEETVATEKQQQCCIQ